ncbi:MAG: FkbM family methyltransferase [Caulobacterales bacterium]
METVASSTTEPAQQERGWTGQALSAAFLSRRRRLGNLIAPLIRRDAVVMDLGAEGGQFVKTFARLAPKGLIYALEPELRRRRLVKIAAAASGKGNIQIEPITLLDAESRTSPEVDTLDSFAAARGFRRLDFVKVHLDGREMQFLRGGRWTIARFKPSLLITLSDDSMATYGDKGQDAFNFLRPLGYATTRIVDDKIFDAEDYAGPGRYTFTPARAPGTAGLTR